MANVGVFNFAGYTTISVGVLRNGAAVGVARTARVASLAPKYHFRGVRYEAALDGDVAAFAPACPVALVLDAQIRCAFAVLVEAEVVAANTAHVNAGGLGAFDADAARLAAVSNPGNRVEAIALGAADAALVMSYHITDADLRAVETGAALVSMVAPANSVSNAAYNASMGTIDRGWSIQLASGHDDANATNIERHILDMPALTADETDLAYACLAIGQSGPARAGAQLLIDGHHYHSDVDASKRHQATEKEVTAEMTTAGRNIWRANTMLIRNAVWHASPHRVNESVLEGFAVDPEMPERLNATGFGSMSVGFPAEEDLFKRAGSYIAVLNQVEQTARAHGHSIALDDLKATVAALRGLPIRGQLPAVRPAIPGAPAAAWPAGCTTRAHALKIFLEPALDRAEPVAAWLFGFYKEICSRNGVRATSQEGSLLRSYSLKRAVMNHLGEANRAQEMYGARARYIKAQADDGKLETYVGSA